MTPDKGVRFWDRIANRYAARPIKDVAAYEALLTAAAAHMNSGGSVLELGCGTGGSAIRLAPSVATFLATDFSAEMIRIARSKRAPKNLHFKVTNAENAFVDGPFDAISAFNMLHLVDDLPDMLGRIHTNLRQGGLLVSKTWCFADLGLKFRILFAGLRIVGMFPPAASLGAAQLRQSIVDAGFEIIDQRVFGAHPQNPYILARKPLPDV